jgi:hypothetical protein
MLEEEVALRTDERRDAPCPDDQPRSTTEREGPAGNANTSARYDDRTEPSLNTGLLWGQLDTLEEDMLQEVRSEDFFHNLVVGTTAVGVTGLTVGYVAWLVRGGTLLASMISAMPAWVSFDPLPVLDTFQDRKSATPDEQEEQDDNLDDILR